nr:MAG TPA: hypothetical protein [Inoviridae sp.]
MLQAVSLRDVAWKHRANQDHEKSSSHGGAAFFMRSALAGSLDRRVIPCVG